MFSSTTLMTTCRHSSFSAIFCVITPGLVNSSGLSLLLPWLFRSRFSLLPRILAARNIIFFPQYHWGNFMVPLCGAVVRLAVGAGFVGCGCTGSGGSIGNFYWFFFQLDSFVLFSFFLEVSLPSLLGWSLLMMIMIILGGVFAWCRVHLWFLWLGYVLLYKLADDMSSLSANDFVSFSQ